MVKIAPEVLVLYVIVSANLFQGGHFGSALFVLEIKGGFFSCRKNIESTIQIDSMVIDQSEFVVIISLLFCVS